ncbi:GntR family transcriptional regulator [Bacillus sp. FJAT-44742]|uniref:GntR family transcriptional regulator n=1 Tax=Bacillus sp. FJAT-44742 TaxID=2014005 RepID=UPI000C2405B3|nr:GntR family transcriptional regulator [Bacillus sp. FJAT-44742]
MKLPIRVSEESREPLYHQIETQLQSLIVSGKLPPGTPLPSIRALASELSCSVITTRKAYQNLEGRALIKTIQGKGTFVKEVEEQRKEDTKQQVIVSAFLKAVEQADQVGSTQAEMKSLFDQALLQYFDNKINKSKGGKEDE